MNVAIIGLGAVGTASLYHLVEQLTRQSAALPITLYLFEKSPQLASGLPYAPDYPFILLNRPAYSMSIKQDAPQDFVHWLQRNKTKLANTYPDIASFDPEAYLPRSLFGLYLQDVLACTIQKARQHGILIKIISESVIALYPEANQYRIITPNFRCLVNYTILSLGHLRCKKFQALSTYPGYFNSPYPTTQLVNQIKKSAEVGIIGSRLSAIDAALALTENGHQGKIIFYSRHGLLPSIKANPAPAMMSEIYRTIFLNHITPKAYSLKQICKHFSLIASQCYQDKTVFSQWFTRPQDPICFLQKELAHNNHPLKQIWDTILLESNVKVEEYWHHLPVSEKRFFFHYLKSKWMSYRVSIPKTNAVKILNLLQTGQLSIISGNAQFDFCRQQQKFIWRNQKTEYLWDNMINASGTPVLLSDMDSPLLDYLAKRGFITPNEFGGIDVDYASSQILTPKCRLLKNCYAIGAITTGTYLFTSVLSLNINHAYRIATTIAKGALHENKSFLAPLAVKVYQLVWLTTLVSNIGTWTHNLSAALLMTKLTHSATLNALVQTASMIPIFLFAFVAGIIADLYDRKIIIIIAQLGMALVALTMAICTHFGFITPISLLMMLFLINIGQAFNQPTWQVISSTLVPKTQIKQAAVLNNLSFNLSRCIGPCIAGFFFAKLGPAWLFLLNALSFLGVIIVFITQVESTQVCHLYSLKENFIQSCKESVTFIRCFELFRYILIKAFLYFIISSCLWALLPYLIIIHCHLRNSDLGLLMAAAGIGAIINSFICYYLRSFWTDKHITTFALILNALIFYKLSTAHHMPVLLLLMFSFGISWSMAVSVFNGMMQAEFPLNARARLIGIYYLCFSAAQALGGCWTGFAIHEFGVFPTLISLAAGFFLLSGWYVVTETIQRAPVKSTD